jgi:hypothetical protein
MAPSVFGPRPQVGDLAQILERRPLRLDRVGVRVVDPTDHLDGVGLQLHGLTLSLALDQRPARNHRAAGRQLPDLAFVVRQRRGGDDLERVETRPVVQMDERQSRPWSRGAFAPIRAR